MVIGPLRLQLLLHTLPTKAPITYTTNHPEQSPLLETLSTPPSQSKVHATEGEEGPPGMMTRPLESCIKHCEHPL